jgi:peroxiredoxin
LFWTKKYNLFLALCLFVLILGCGSKQKVEIKDPYPKKNMDFLNSLKKVEPYEMEGLQVSSEKTKVYTQDGKQLSSYEVVKITQSGDYTLDAYRNKKDEIVWLFQPFTDEMKKAKMDQERLMGLKADLVGTNAIPFATEDLNGKKYSLDGLKGKVIVMNFWFIACGPCVAEMPELNKMVKEYEEKEIVFLGFALDPREKLNSFLEKRPFDYVIFPGSDDLIAKYKINVFPTHLIIDKEGKIKYHFTGSLDSKGIVDLKAQIDKAL